VYDWEKPNYKKTCKDFRNVGVQCCIECHEPEFIDTSLRIVKVDGEYALLCCALVAWFYPRDPGRGLSPEEKLLRAIFGEKSVHPAAEKYIDPIIHEPDFEDDY
jgi:hypothetical protein